MESNGPSPPRDDEPLTPGSATKVPPVRAWLCEDGEAESLGQEMIGQGMISLWSPYYEAKSQPSRHTLAAWGSASCVLCVNRCLA